MSASARLPRILVIGTGDTKSEELLFMAEVIGKAGGVPVMVDVSILGDAPYIPDHCKHAVAAAAGTSIAAIVDGGDENSAMAAMARGAAELVRGLSEAGEVDGMIALGGSLGTDLALDVAAVLPLGVPKFIVSTIAYSHLLPPERIAPDLMMILWAGGLYGLNPICRAVLSQACGAVVGAAKAVEKPGRERPLIGMTSLGSSCLKYMKVLKPEMGGSLRISGTSIGRRSPPAQPAFSMRSGPEVTTEPFCALVTSWMQKSKTAANSLRAATAS